jgi:hypothetical protein
MGRDVAIGRTNKLIVKAVREKERMGREYERDKGKREINYFTHYP